MLARALGEALAPGRTRVLNAALTSFDDIRGFIRPGSLESGRVEIVPGPWSPYKDHFLFVDELSRAPTLQQGRWLQLLHERLVDGQPTDVRWVVAAMNPPTVDGTFPLGLATADRFMAVLALHEFRDFAPATRLAIATGRTRPDVGADAGAALRGLISAVAAAAETIRADRSLHEALALTALAALDGFGDTPEAPFRPQGRRAFLMTEYFVYILAALQVERGVAAATEAFQRHLGQLVDDALGHVALTIDLSNDRLRPALTNANRLAARTFARHVPRAGETRDERPADAATMRASARKALADEVEHPTLPPAMFAEIAMAAWGPEPVTDKGVAA
jgi:hypothetical protein